jgi:MFS family permease
MHKAIKILIGASIFFNFSAGLFGPIYAIFVERIGGDILTASTAWAAYSIVIGFLIMVFGKMEDRLNRRKMVILGYFMSAMGTSGYLFVSSPIHLYVVQIFLGIATAVLNPAWNAIFSTSLDKHRESSEWAYWEGAIRIDAGIAAVIGGAIATFFGFRTLFILMAATSFGGALISTLFLRKKIWEDFLKEIGKLSKI